MHFDRLVLHYKMPCARDPLQLRSWNVTRKSLSIFHQLEFIVFTPYDECWHVNFWQQMRDLGREIRVKGGGVPNERKFSDFG